jgi:hypothetical protein
VKITRSVAGKFQLPFSWALSAHWRPDVGSGFIGSGQRVRGQKWRADGNGGFIGSGPGIEGRMWRMDANTGATEMAVVGAAFLLAIGRALLEALSSAIVFNKAVDASCRSHRPGRSARAARSSGRFGHFVSDACTGPQPGARLRCPLIMYAGRQWDNRKDLVVIGRHLHRVDFVLRAAHDINNNIQVERELFQRNNGPVLRSSLPLLRGGGRTAL